MLIQIYFNKQLFLLQALDGPKIASLECHHPFWSLSCFGASFFSSSLFPTSKTFIFNFTSQAGSFHGFPFLHVPGLEVTNSKVIKKNSFDASCALNASRPFVTCHQQQNLFYFTPAASPLSCGNVPGTASLVLLCYCSNSSEGLRCCH